VVVISVNKTNEFKQDENMLLVPLVVDECHRNIPGRIRYMCKTELHV